MCTLRKHDVTISRCLWELVARVMTQELWVSVFSVCKIRANSLAHRQISPRLPIKFIFIFVCWVLSFTLKLQWTPPFGWAQIRPADRNRWSSRPAYQISSNLILIFIGQWACKMYASLARDGTQHLPRITPVIYYCLWQALVSGLMFCRILHAC